MMLSIFNFFCILCLLFFQSPDIYKIYVEEFKNERIPYKDCPELIRLLLEFSSTVSSLFEECKVRNVYLPCSVSLK